ncbi:MAG: nucleotidyltransferase family protein [Acidobacteria bacterium]|nr:nucleotidyltransferase family protein [Acidobacteriota bacterium]
MIAGVILAAGESQRMGQAKALLPYKGTTFLGHVIRALDRSGLGAVYVVLGHGADHIISQVEWGPAYLLVNPHYGQGQLSSVQTALRHLKDRAEAVVLCLIDHPLVSSVLVRSLLGAFRETQAPVVLPVCHGRRGHPVLFSRRVFPELLSAPPEVGARAVVRAHAAEVVEVKTEDEGILVNVDTPEAYRALLNRNDDPALP